MALKIFARSKIMRKLTTEQFIEKARAIYGSFYIYSSTVYKNSKKKVTIICPIHGEFYQTPNDHLSGHGCSDCGDIKCSKHKHYTQEEWVALAKKKHNNKYTYPNTIYLGYLHEVIITCPIEEHGDFLKFPIRHLAGDGCNKCALIKISESKKCLPDDFIRKVKERHNNKYTYDKTIYLGCIYDIIITCPVKGHGDFTKSAGQHLLGVGCPKCSKVISNGERFAFNTLNKLNYKFTSQYKLKLLNSKLYQKIDFYIEDLNLFIEYNGRQHYEPVKFSHKTTDEEVIKIFNLQKNRDQELRLFCKKNNINLLEIDSRKCEYSNASTLPVLEKYVNDTIYNYIFRLKSKLYFTRNKVD